MRQNMKAGRQGATSKASAAARSKRVRTLIVDDAAVTLDLLCRHLGELPAVEVVGTAGNGEQAVRRAAELKPDLVVMDINMPGMDGLKATETITAEPGAPAVILVSLHAERSYRAAALRAGAAAFCNKLHMHDRLAPLIASLFPPEDAPAARTPTAARPKK